MLVCGSRSSDDEELTLDDGAMCRGLLRSTFERPGGRRNRVP